MQRDDRKTIDALEIRVSQRMLEIPWEPQKLKESVLLSVLIEKHILEYLVLMVRNDTEI